MLNSDIAIEKAQVFGDEKDIENTISIGNYYKAIGVQSKKG